MSKKVIFPALGVAELQKLLNDMPHWLYGDVKEKNIEKQL